MFWKSRPAIVQIEATMPWVVSRDPENGSWEIWRHTDRGDWMDVPFIRSFLRPHARGILSQAGLTGAEIEDFLTKPNK